MGGDWDFIVPPGTILPFVGVEAPVGWLLCRGQAVSRSTYAKLFEVLGVTFGEGNGTTTFRLPDLRKRIPLGHSDPEIGEPLGLFNPVALQLAAGGPVAMIEGLGYGDGFIWPTPQPQLHPAGEMGGSLRHTHFQPAHSHVGPSHRHVNYPTDPGGAHTHTQGQTDFSGVHTHTNPRVGNSSVGAENPDAGTSGLMSQRDLTHHHGGSTYAPADPSHQHDHSQGVTGTSTSHRHSNPDMSIGHHQHNQGQTGFSGDAATGDAGGEDTGHGDPPYLVVNFIVRT